MQKILIYLHTIYLLKSSPCFEHYPAHLQEFYVVIVYMQPLVSSLSAGDCLVHRLRKKERQVFCTQHSLKTVCLKNITVSRLVPVRKAQYINQQK